MKHYDIIVVGGGNAGIEAAYAAHKIHPSVALLTNSFDNLGTLSCNPSIGGIGKGHLVCEIDALGGIMGQLADSSCIHFRMLNRSKGAAVWGPRMQVDRTLYKKKIRHIFLNKNIIIEDRIDFIHKVNNGFVVVGKKTSYQCKALIIATGTFLRGKTLISNEYALGGRLGEKGSDTLSQSLEALGLHLYRLKTGTPPRIQKNSIDLDRCVVQWPENPIPFANFLNLKIKNPQIPCYLTYTNEETHKIIQQHLYESAVYSGYATHRGPRYCPSIEDKIVKFSTRSSHQIFLEPEGLHSSLIYPAGISNSLPKTVQEKFIHTIKGLENAVIEQYGYAVEYDCIEHTCLTHTLMLKDVPGLFTAGQINGTTGYEEAAAQGLIAGLNAALYVQKRSPFILSRTISYMGVMIDDLVRTKLTEPYRMFSSRAEYRLNFRYDNAYDRLYPLACTVYPKKNFHLMAEFLNKKQETIKVLQKLQQTPQGWKKIGIHLKEDGIRRSVWNLLGMGISIQTLKKCIPAIKFISNDLMLSISRDSFYAPYIEKQKQDIHLVQHYENIKIDKDFSYQSIIGLSNEMIERLEKQSPVSLYDALHLDGITPVAMVLLIRHFQQYIKINQSNVSRETLLK